MSREFRFSRGLTFRSYALPTVCLMTSSRRVQGLGGAAARDLRVHGSLSAMMLHVERVPALTIDAMEGLSHRKAACYIVLCTNSHSKHLAFGAQRLQAATERS